MYYVETVVSGGPCRIGGWTAEAEAADYAVRLADWWPYRVRVKYVPSVRVARRRFVVGYRRAAGRAAVAAAAAVRVGECEHGGETDGVCRLCAITYE